jgi:hypothetical protein
MEKVAKETKAQQEKRNRRRIEIASQRKMRLLSNLLIACATVRVGSRWRVVRDMTASVYWHVLNGGRVNMDMDVPGVAMAVSHQACN